MLKVAMCWDDGVLNDIRLTEMIRKYNAKATFNLNPGLFSDKRGEYCWIKPDFRGWNFRGFVCGKLALSDLKEVYGDFCVASHCWKHETVGNVSDEAFIKAAVDAKKFLEDLFQKECPGFAWPCGVHSPTTCQLLREAGFKYGRTCEYTDDVTQCADTMKLASNCHYQATNFWECYEKAKKLGKAFYFWGHSYEMIDSPGLWQQFEDKISIISADPDTEWVNVIDLVELCNQNSNTEQK